MALIKEEKDRRHKVARKNWKDKNKEHVKKYEKEYSKRPEVKIRRKKYQRDYIKKYLKNNDKHKIYLIRQSAYGRLRKNIIKEREACEVCKSKENLEIHHEEYINQPECLRLLCRKCHRKLHSKLWRTSQ